jgi:protein-tyrosine phosphatase
MSQVLFLCSGNYYRSRFAEYLFNWLAENSGLDWRAESRGLTVGCAGNIGPISRYAIERLHALGISIESDPRMPLQVAESDLAEADRIIALKEGEHRSLIAKLFPSWEHRVEYWHIDDLDCAEPDDALTALEDDVRTLAGRLDDVLGTSSSEHLQVA